MNDRMRCAPEAYLPSLAAAAGSLCFYDEMAEVGYLNPRREHARQYGTVGCVKNITANELQRPRERSLGAVPSRS